jgi:hypothetical protein
MRRLGLSRRILQTFPKEELFTDYRSKVPSTVAAPDRQGGSPSAITTTVSVPSLERKQWETFSRSNEHLLEKFRTISAWPRKIEVRRIPFGEGARSASARLS